VKKIVVELLKYNKTIAFHSLEEGGLLYPQYDLFSLHKKEFEPYFWDHPIPK